MCARPSLATRAAARRVEQLVADGVSSGAFRSVHVAFVADVLSATMVRIQQRQVAAATGLGDAEAYTELAALVVRGLTPTEDRSEMEVSAVRSTTAPGSE